MQELSTIHKPLDSGKLFLQQLAEFQLRLRKFNLDHGKDLIVLRALYKYREECKKRRQDEARIGGIGGW